MTPPALFSPSSLGRRQSASTIQFPVHQPGISGAFIGWLQQFGLSTDGSVDLTDSDGDLLNNWQEWIAGTNPANALSALRLLAPSVQGTKIIINWQSAVGVTYSLERTGNISDPFTSLITGIQGLPGTTSYSDTNALGAGPFFYRVRVGGF
jgi:hypothetical protein